MTPEKKMTAKQTIVLLEFPDEAEAYLANAQAEGVDSSTACIISLNPKLHVWLDQRGLKYSDSQAYFTTEAHARSLNKSHDLLQWLESRTDLEDGLKISKAYNSGLVWYCRYFLHHMLWLSEIITEAHRQSPDAAIVAPVSHPTGAGNPFVQDHDRYLGLLAEEYCRGEGVEFHAVEFQPAAAGRSHAQSRFGWVKGPGARIGAMLHRAALRRMGRYHPLLALTHSYRMEDLVSQSRKHRPELPWAILGEGARSLTGKAVLQRAVTALTGFGVGNKGDRYLGEVWLQLLQKGTKEEPDFVRRLADTVDSIAIEAEGSAADVFSHQGISFGTSFADKIRTGIGEAMRQMHREVLAADDLLDRLAPRLVMTPIGRRSYNAIGELCQRKGIPGLLVSHGSFSPMKNELEEKGWDFHSYGLFHGSYSHSVLQTPLAEQFAQQITSTANFVKTGPLIWGMQAPEIDAQSLKTRLAPGYEHCKIVVHAGTPKLRLGPHFHVYETPDEYIQAIRDLILAAEEADIFVVVKYRPTILSVQELASLLPESDRYCISVEEPFLDVLSISDLLVSFSSTTIEEAFQNRVPVLQYGGGGRYQHVEGFEVSPETSSIEPLPVYTVRSSEHLAGSLRRILNAFEGVSSASDTFDRFVYRQDEVVPFTELLDGLIGGFIPAGPKERTMPLGSSSGGNSR